VPYYAEVMTGFEYAAAVHMLYEGMTEEGLRCISDIRARYDGERRNPFDEAECGHHYARAMTAWAAVLALTGFHYSGVDASMALNPSEGCHFWSTGYAWGTCGVRFRDAEARVHLDVLGGLVSLRRFILTGYGQVDLGAAIALGRGASKELRIERDD
jgi:hypothetical protein